MMKEISMGLGKREVIQAGQVDVPLRPRAEQAGQPLWTLSCPGGWPWPLSPATVATKAETIWPHSFSANLLHI